MENKAKNLEFLQSEQWRKFQESVGRKAFYLEKDGFSASIIEHSLPIVGKYFYVPRGPVASLEGEEFPISNFQFPIKSQFPISNDRIKNGMQELVKLAKKNNAGWIRFDANDNQILELINSSILEKIVKAPHDMQPREIFVIDITKPEQELLAEMKSKTRYNINIAKKKEVVIASGTQEHIDAFLQLTKETALRQGIVTHPDEYYRKMIATFPSEMLKIYVAKYEGKIIAANLVLFFGKYATYLHGASASVHRNVMAPYLLQWQAILDAKNSGCTHYDFGGISTKYESDTNVRITNKWAGITTFKTGFSPQSKPVEFPGSYDIIINPVKYTAYSLLQKIKAAAYKMKKM